MKIKKVTDPEFSRYGRVIDGYDFSKLIKAMEHTPLPEDVIYEPSIEELETTDVAIDLKMRVYGELPIQQDIEPDFTYDTSKVEAFLVPAGIGIEVYGTTLHYAPCGVDGNGFKAVVVLPKGTNTDLMTCHTKSFDDKLLTAKNKWLIAHEEAGIEGAVCGLKGENIDIAK